MGARRHMPYVPNGEPLAQSLCPFPDSNQQTRPYRGCNLYLLAAGITESVEPWQYCNSRGDTVRDAAAPRRRHCGRCIVRSTKPGAWSLRRGPARARVLLARLTATARPGRVTRCRHRRWFWRTGICSFGPPRAVIGRTYSCVWSKTVPRRWIFPEWKSCLPPMPMSCSAC